MCVCVCEGGYIEKCLGLVVRYGELKFCTGWSHREVVVWVERGGHGKCCQMVSREVKRIRGRGGGVKIGPPPVI